MFVATFHYIFFLPAATKLGQGNKFTGVCLSTRGGGRGVPGLVPGGYLVRTRRCTWQTSPLDQVPPRPGTPPGTRYTPPGPGTPPEQVHPPGTRYTPLRIRTTSGRYASYWSAFFLLNTRTEKVKMVKNLSLFQQHCIFTVHRPR